MVFCGVNISSSCTFHVWIAQLLSLPIIPFTCTRGEELPRVYTARMVTRRTFLGWSCRLLGQLLFLSDNGGN